MNLKSAALAALLFLSSVFILFAQQEPAESIPASGASPAEGVPAPGENGETVYVIRSLEFDIDGRTKEFVLVTRGEFEEGERITGRENFERYLARKRQLLINERVLEDVNIEYSLGEAEEDGALPVKLLVHVKDSWNFIALPYPKYDSNDGLSITLKARDYNFLGTMNALRVDLGYRQQDDEKEVNFSVDTDLPFQALGLNWNINLENYFTYTFGEPLYYQNVTGLSVDLPWQATTVNLGFNHYLTFNEEISDENRENYGLTDDYYEPYGATELFAYWEIPFGFEVGDFGELTYTPGLKGRINYPYGSLDEPRKPVTTLSHALGFGRIDWIGNYQKGLSASLNNAYSWYFDRSDAPIRISFDGDAIAHWPFSKYLGVSARFRYQQWWQWSYDANSWLPTYDVGSVIRGVLDDDIRAYRIFSFNLDIPIRVLRFWPSEWFANPKLRLFNFEMHFAPFTDTILLEGPYNNLKDDPYEGSEFGLGDMINTGGLEVRVFPDFFRSLKIRGSVGYNLQKIKSEGFPPLKWGFFPQWDEIYIGLDFFY